MLDPSQSQIPSAFQYIPVPNHHVSAVFRLLAELDAGIPVAITNEGWSNADLARLERGEVETTIILSEVMDVLAASPGDWFDITELAKATNRDRSQIRMLWTHLTRHLKAHYDGAGWPVNAKWGTNLAPQRDAVVYYSLDHDQAAQWKEVRNA